MSAAEDMRHVANDNAEQLAEYSFNADTGESEGSENAASYEAAACQWGEHLSNGGTRLMQVYGPDGAFRWLLIERHRKSVSVREVTCECA